MQRKRVASSTACSVMKCPRCCGVASTAVFRPAVCRVLHSGLWWNVSGNASSSVRPTTTPSKQTPRPLHRSPRSCCRSTEHALQRARILPTPAKCAPMLLFSMPSVAPSFLQASKMSISLFAALKRSHTVHHRSLRSPPAPCSKRQAANCACPAARS